MKVFLCPWESHCAHCQLWESDLERSRGDFPHPAKMRMCRLPLRDKEDDKDIDRNRIVIDSQISWLETLERTVEAKLERETS
jgi:hypothetical protein